MKKLKVEHLKTRRNFLKGLVRKAAAPSVIVYGIHKNAPPVFAREPI